MAVRDRPRGPFLRALTAGWGWLGALRAVLGTAIAVYALSFRALPSHPPDRFTALIAFLLGLTMAATGILQATTRFRSSRLAAQLCLVLDVLIVFATLALYAFDPRGHLLVLVPAIQGEAGVVLGTTGALAVWFVTSGAYVGVEAFSSANTGFPMSFVDVGLRIAVGFVLAVGGGLLFDELSEERLQAQVEREHEFERLQDIVGRLAETEQKYRALVEQTPALLYIDRPDEHQTPVYIGPRFEQMFGVTAEEYLADPFLWDRMVHPDDRERALFRYAEAVRDGRAYSEEYRILTPDGRLVWVHDDAVVLRDQEGRPSLVHGVMFDITDRKAADDRERRDRTYAEALRDTAMAAMRRLDPDEVLETIVSRAAALVGTAHGYAYLRDADGDGLEVRCGAGLFTDWLGFRMRSGEGVAGRVVATGQPLVIDDYDRWSGRSAGFPRGILRSVVGVPLKSGDDVTGAIGLAHVSPDRRFLPEEVLVLTQFADIASVALDNAYLYAAAREEIRQREQAEAELERLAFHDPLTDLPNRAMFEEMLGLALARARRKDHAVAVLYLDLDNFKLINDSLGHAAGDRLLRLLAGRLRKLVRGSDVVARQGGDEFLLLLADFEGGASGDEPADVVTRAEWVADRIRGQLRRPFRFSGTEVYVSASIGISVFPYHAADAKTLLRYADVAMYAGKRSHPGSTRVFSGDDPVGKLSLATRIRKAVENAQLCLHYQPIVQLEDGGIVGVEALLRWPQADGTLLAPANFLPLVEEMGLMPALGEWVLEETCRQTQVWRAAGATIFATCNVSLPQLWQPDLAARILRLIRSTGVDPSDIVIEITESSAMRDPERTAQILEDLHQQGLGLAIDDFGSGHSSLSRLRHLAVDIVKIDRPFLEGLPEDAAAAASVRAIVQLAEGLSMQPLAEGVETEGQRRYLIDNGCSLGQGFLFSPAVPPETIGDWLREGALHLPLERSPI